MYCRLVSSSKIRKLEDMIAKKDSMIAELEAAAAHENKLWRGPDSESRTHGPHSASFQHTREVIHAIVTDRKKLYAMTLIPMESFECLPDWFVAMADAADDTPLFWENADRSSDPGNRCKLRYDEALLLLLVHLKTNQTQAALGVIFGTDQSTACRYLKFGKKILRDILPTPDNMYQIISSAHARKKLEELVPNMTVMIDGTHIRTTRPEDAVERNKRFGPKKAATASTAVMINRKKIILGSVVRFPGASTT